MKRAYYRFGYQLLLVILIVSGILLFGCDNSPMLSGGGTEVGNPKTSLMISFNNSEELSSYMKNQIADSILPSEAYTNNNSTNTLSKKYIDDSLHNNQKVIDQNGLFYIYDDRQMIHIVDINSPENMELIHSIRMPGPMYHYMIKDHWLIVHYIPNGGEGEKWSYSPDNDYSIVGMPYWLPVDAQTGLLLIDISDPFFPTIQKDLIIDGSFISMQIVQDKLYFMIQYLPDLPPLTLTYDGTEQNREEALSSNQNQITSFQMDDLLPKYQVKDSQGLEGIRQALFSYESIFSVDGATGGSIVSILTIQLNDPTLPIKNMGLMMDVHLFHTTSNAFFCSTTRWTDQNQYNTQLFYFTYTEQGIACQDVIQIPGVLRNGSLIHADQNVLSLITTQNDQITLYNVAFDDELTIIGSLFEPNSFPIQRAWFNDAFVILSAENKYYPIMFIDLIHPDNPIITGKVNLPGSDLDIISINDTKLMIISKDVLQQDNQLETYLCLTLINPNTVSIIQQKRIKAFHIETDSLTMKTTSNHLDYMMLPIRIYHSNGIDQKLDFLGTYVYSIQEDTLVLSGKISLNSMEQSSQDIPQWQINMMESNTIYSITPYSIFSTRIDQAYDIIGQLYFQ